MPAPTLTYDELIALQLCEGRLAYIERKIGGPRKWNGNRVTAQEAREAGVPFQDVVWAASAKARHDKDVARRFRMWAADCAAHVLHIYENSGNSDAPRKSIIAARQFARGEINAAARDAATAAASAAATDAALAAARHAAWAAASAAARDAEETWQFDRLIAWLSDNEPDDWPLPEIAGQEAA